MDPKELKKVLAGLGVATLVSAVGVAVPGHLLASSGWGAKPDGTVGADKTSSSGTSGCGGKKEGEASVDLSKCPEKGEMSDECRKAREAEAKAKADQEKMAPKPGGSGWGGNK